jgi:hypothetical protein
VRGLYVLAIVLMVFPLLELFTTVWPFRFGDMAWRYAAFGITANYAYRSLVGLALFMALAYWFDHPHALRYAGVLALVTAGLILPLMVAFGLDLPAVAELRGEGQRNSLVAGAFQEFKYAGTFLALSMLGLGALGTARSSLQSQSGGVTPGSPGALRTPPTG